MYMVIIKTQNRRPNNIQKTSLQSYMKSKFYLFLGLPNRALNNPAQGLPFLAGLNLYIKTTCRPIRSVIILVINKSDSRFAVVQFCYHSYDNRQNWTPLSPVTITCYTCIDTSVLLENIPLVKFIRNHIRDSSGVFSISSLVKISMISLISSLSLKLYLNSLVYH